jgi:NitT/TauT family transport system substrate-binding protein
VESGEALTNGIGAMNAARIKDFYDDMVRAGLYKAGDVDLAKVVDTRFVNRKMGIGTGKSLRP